MCQNSHSIVNKNRSVLGWNKMLNLDGSSYRLKLDVNQQARLRWPCRDQDVTSVYMSTPDTDRSKWRNTTNLSSFVCGYLSKEVGCFGLNMLLDWIDWIFANVRGHFVGILSAGWSLQVLSGELPQYSNCLFVALIVPAVVIACQSGWHHPKHRNLSFLEVCWPPSTPYPT